MATAVDDKHELCRKKVCVVCYRKADRGLSVTDISLVREFIIEDYETSNPDFPCGVCNGCHLLLSKKSRNADVVLPTIDDYNPQRKYNLRNTSLCECKICQVTRLTKQDHMKLKKSPGRRPSSELQPQSYSSKFKICAKCYAKLYPGCSHSPQLCSSKKQKLQNVGNLIDSPTKQRLAREVNDSACDPSSAETVPIFSIADMSDIQRNLNLSCRQVDSLAHDLRFSAGRHCIQSNLRRGIYIRNHELDDYFELRNIKYFTSSGDGSTRPSVVCNDINAFIDKVLMERADVDLNSALIKFGIDGGGDSSSYPCQYLTFNR